MKYMICTNRLRDNNGAIFGYTLTDLSGTQVNTMSAESLKSYIKSKKISVNNLTLTSDGRLIYHDNNKKQEKIIRGYIKTADNIAKKVFKAFGYEKYINDIICVNDGKSNNHIDRRYSIKGKYIVCDDVLVNLSIMIVNSDDVFYISFETDEEQNFYEINTDCSNESITKAVNEFIKVSKNHTGLYEMRRIL